MIVVKGLISWAWSIGEFSYKPVQSPYSNFKSLFLEFHKASLVWPPAEVVRVKKMIIRNILKLASSRGYTLIEDLIKGSWNY